MLRLASSWLLRISGLLIFYSPAWAQCAAAPIVGGQTLTGTLTANCASKTLGGGHGRIYSFTANTGETITISVTSATFAARLFLVTPSGGIAGTEDRQGVTGGHSVQVTAAATGVYTVEVASFDPALGDFTISLAIGAAGAPAVSKIVNGASYAEGVAPGSWITIRGMNLSATTRAWGAADFRGSSLPAALDGVSVKVNNKDAAVYYISPAQINALAPADTATGTVQVAVTNSRGQSAQSAANLQRMAPAFFTFSQGNGQYPAAVHVDGTYLAPDGLFGSAVPSVPAKMGETILLFGTGFGPTTPPADPMQMVSGALPLTTPNDLVIWIGGMPAKVLFAGMTGSGLYQFNVVVPDNTIDGESRLEASIGGVRTPVLWLPVKTPPAPPVLTAISLTSVLWGQKPYVTLTGTGLASVNKVVLSPPEGLSLPSGLAAPPPGGTSLTFQLAVGAGAVDGDHTVTVSSPYGVSNALKFTVRRGSPRLTAISPTVVYPDRFYALNLWYTSSRSAFQLTGVDLAGVDQVNFKPPDGLTPLWTYDTDLGIYGYLRVDAGAPTGPHQVTVSSPAGESPGMTLTVQAPPATAPAISGVTLQAAAVSGSTITYRGTLSFADSDGDIRSTCKDGTYGISLDLSSCAFMSFAMIGSRSASLDVTGASLNLSGQTTGQIDFTFTVTNINRYVRSTGAAQVAVTLWDAARHPSNAVFVTAPSWAVPVL
jgi:uncharacterized protein (TIGR03437 family)